MSSLSNALRPRDQQSAARVLVAAVMLAMLATVGWRFLEWAQGRPGSGPGPVASAVVALVVFAGLGAIVLRAPHRVPLLVWPAVAVLQPVGTAVTVIGLDDASAGAQFGLVYAVVFAASQFGRLFAWSVTVLAIAADAAIVYSVLEPGRATSDLLVVACALPMITIVLQMTNAHGDRLRDDLDALATTDALTGVSTRRALETAATELTTRAGSDADPRVGLVLLDVDRFKAINDEHGHPAGDAILVHLAGILRSRTHPSDVVARLGGDEFAVLVRGDAETIADRAQSLHGAVRAGMEATPGRPHVTVSIGYAVARPGKELEELYRAADRALYEAKAGGRDQVVAEEPWGDLV